MKNLFNNPWFVGTLALTAVIYLVVQVLGYLPGDNSAQMAMSAELFDPDPDAGSQDAHSLAPTIDSAGRVDRKLIGWLEQPVRDPFRSEFREPALGAAHDTPPQKPARAQPVLLPGLQAVFHRGDAASAVINGTLVEIGDQIDGFRVNHIAPNSVAVSKSGKSYTLTAQQQ